ncbi:MAG: hypothetical protein DRN17_05630 [Thermoplasmata archaeon]|nr:MAG: hypothetical protein DRN17_05630 [Thermoplasmata archaeon]
MTINEIQTATDAGKIVCWRTSLFVVTKNSQGYEVVCLSTGSTMGLLWMDGITLNGNEEDFFLQEEELTYCSVSSIQTKYRVKDVFTKMINECEVTVSYLAEVTDKVDEDTGVACRSIDIEEVDILINLTSPMLLPEKEYILQDAFLSTLVLGTKPSLNNVRRKIISSLTMRISNETPNI